MVNGDMLSREAMLHIDEFCNQAIQILPANFQVYTVKLICKMAVLKNDVSEIVHILEQSLSGDHGDPTVHMIFLNLGALFVREFECLENLQTITKKNYRDLLSEKISAFLLGDQTEIRIDILFASLSQIWLRYPDLLPIQNESPVFDKL